MLINQNFLLFSKSENYLNFIAKYVVILLIYICGACIYIYMLCRVGCRRSGGMRFTINGRDYFELVLISNVGGAGDISRVWIKGSKMNNWESMSRNWGANWQSLSYLNGQSLSFRLHLTNGKTRTAINVVPSNWRFGQSFITNP